MAQEKQDILVAKLMADISSFKKGMDEATTKANQSANKLQKTFAKVGQAMKIGLAAGVAFIAYDAINTIKDFEQGVANLSAVTGQTTQEIQGLTNNALKLGGATAYTAGEVTGLQTELAKLGFREADIVDLTPAILNLAQATGTDLANAASLAGSVVQSFGLAASDTGRVVDIMTKSFSASALDIQKFEVGIRQVAPVAKQAGVELSEVTSILGVLANNGIRAETAGVGLRNILLESAKKGVPFQNLLEEINTSSDKAAKAMELFGKENAAVGVVVAENMGKIAELDISLQASAGTAQEMADKQLNTLQGAITLLTSAWDGMILAFDSGDGVISKVARGSIQAATEFLKLLSGQISFTAKAVKDLNEGLTQSQIVTKESNKEFAKESAQLEILKNKIEATLPGTRERRTLIGELKSSYGDYITGLVDENTNLAKLNGIYESINTKIKERIVLRISEEKQVALLTDQVTKEAQVFEELKRVLKGTDGSVDEHVARLDLMRGRYRDLDKIGKLMSLPKALGGGEAAAVAMMKQLGISQELFKSYQTLGIESEIFRDRMNGLASSANLTDEQLKELRDQVSGYTSTLNDGTDELDDNTDAVDDNTKALGYNAAANEAAMKANEDRIKSEIAAGIPDFDEVDTTGFMDDAATDADIAAMKAFEEQMLKTQEQSAILAAGIQSSFSAISGAIMGSVSEAETGMGRFLRALAANAIEIIGVNLSTAMANAILGATNAGAAAGPAAPIVTPALIASMIGGVIGAFAAIPKFAEGGVVGGSSMTGDKILARLNSNELVLTQQHQNNLLGMINGGNGGGGERLVTKLQGQDILVAIERADNKRTRKRGF